MSSSSQISDFKLISKIGTGAFSTVYKALRTIDNKYYALKKISLSSLSEKERENAFNEIRILSRIHNPHVITYKDSFYDKPSNMLYLITEYCEYGDLEQEIQNHIKHQLYFNESELLKILEQILIGLQALHSNKILHRDLKAANIFICKEHFDVVKIGDLNVSKVLNVFTMKNTQTGTPYYASPEVWNNKPYDYKSDIWSLGCLFFEMAALKAPFTAKNMKELYTMVMNGKVGDVPRRYSDNVRCIVNMCLRKDDKMRPTAEELLGFVRRIKGEYNDNVVVDNDNMGDVCNNSSSNNNVNAVVNENCFGEVKLFKFPNNNYADNNNNNNNNSNISNNVHIRNKSVNNIITTNTNTNANNDNSNEHNKRYCNNIHQYINTDNTNISNNQTAFGFKKLNYHYRIKHLNINTNNNPYQNGRNKTPQPVSNTDNNNNTTNKNIQLDLRTRYLNMRKHNKLLPQISTKDHPNVLHRISNMRKRLQTKQNEPTTATTPQHVEYDIKQEMEGIMRLNIEQSKHLAEEYLMKQHQQHQRARSANQMQNRFMHNCSDNIKRIFNGYEHGGYHNRQQQCNVNIEMKSNKSCNLMQVGGDKEKKKIHIHHIVLPELKKDNGVMKYNNLNKIKKKIGTLIKSKKKQNAYI